MTETPAGYYSDADAIRTALGKHGPLSRADLVKASDVPRDVLAKALYQLKKKGDVIEEGELVMLAKAAKPAQDAPKEVEASTPTTPTPECSTEEIKQVFKPTHPGVVALNEAAGHIIALLGENASLKDKITSLESRLATVSETFSTAERLQAKMDKLRGLLDD
ncbi:MAG: hypothetical protein ACYC0Z_15070 [Acidobacteriaceae bacterium]